MNEASRFVGAAHRLQKPTKSEIRINETRLAPSAFPTDSSRDITPLNVPRPGNCPSLCNIRAFPARCARAPRGTPLHGLNEERTIHPGNRLVSTILAADV